MRVGTVEQSGVALPVAAVAEDSYAALDLPPGTTLLDAIADGAALPLAADGARFGAGDLVAPLRPPKIVAVGLNYMDHVRETGMEAPSVPLLFTKFTTSVIGDGDAIEIDTALTERVDWEVELAVVVGREMRRVPAARALDHVFGYTVANDVSARDVQFADGQWVRGKSLDTFCPLGPAIVTADEIPDPQDIRLTTRVNDELVQDSTTAEMVFDIAELLAFCSHNFTLEPGDVLLTGTPWGCGEFMNPPRTLTPGDTVEVEAQGIGQLRNPVVRTVTGARPRRG